MAKFIEWATHDLAVMAANPKLSVSDLQKMLPHISEYSIRKKRKELAGEITKAPDRGASWSGLDAALCARWNRAFSLMYKHAMHTGRICRAY